MSRPDLVPLATAERSDLADYLATLGDEQWRSPTLCEEWNVRQVAAHIISYDDLRLPQLAARLVRGRFRINRVNPLTLAASDQTPPAEVLANFRAHLRPRGLTTAFRGAIALTDCLIHHQDIRRALGTPRTVPVERLEPVLTFALKAPPLPSRRAMRGLHLVASDLDWSHGDGPEVTGPGEALVMAIAGRTIALDDLEGPGVATARERLVAT